MKKSVVIFGMSALIFFSCNSRKIPKSEIPSLVLNTLKTKYPSMINVDWRKHGNIYEAELKIDDNTEVSLRITEAGELIMQKLDIPNRELSLPITKVVHNQYKDFMIEDVERVEKDGAVYYQIELKGKGKKINLLLLPDGSEAKTISYWH